MNGRAFARRTNLVELEAVQEVVQFAVLGVFGQLDIVLLETVQGQLGLVVDVDLKRLSAQKPPN
jgi:hypothetical protein